MPLPLIPLVLVAGSAATAAFGLKKSYDAYSDNKDAEETGAYAQEIYDKTQKDLNDNRENLNQKIIKFGEFKEKNFEKYVLKFIEIFDQIKFEQIKNVEFNDKVSKEMNVDMDFATFEKIKKEIFDIGTMLGGTAGSLGAGAAAGFGAFGLTGALATASTGTAIGSLSGAAATNATLAWLGGGSLASGGLGMAGGTMVLGGVVAGPALAVAGFVLASAAEKKKDAAYSNLSKAKAIRESNNAIINKLTLISKSINSLRKCINLLIADYLYKFNKSLAKLVEQNNDYSTYSKEEKELVHISLNTAQTVKNLIIAPVLDEKGELLKSVDDVIQTGYDLLEKLAKIENKYK